MGIKHLVYTPDLDLFLEEVLEPMSNGLLDVLQMKPIVTGGTLLHIERYRGRIIKTWHGSTIRHQILIIDNGLIEPNRSIRNILKIVDIRVDDNRIKEDAPIELIEQYKYIGCGDIKELVTTVNETSLLFKTATILGLFTK